MAKIKRALISVSDKTGILDFAKELKKLGIEIISTGGTAKLMRENNIPCDDRHRHRRTETYCIITAGGKRIAVAISKRTVALCRRAVPDKRRAGHNAGQCYA